MRSLLLALLPAAFLSCQKTPTAAILSGQIEGLESQYLVLYKSADRYGFRDWLSALDTVPVSPGGIFRFEISLTEPDFFQICDDKGYTQTLDLYLAPGDSLSVIRHTVNDRFKFDYAGSRAGAYAYFALRDSLHQSDPLFKGNYRDLYYLSVDSATTFLVRRLQWEKDLINSSFQGNPEWQHIQQHVTDQRRYENYEQYYRYLYYHNYYTQDTFLYLIPDTSFYDFMKEVDLSYCPDRYMWEYQAFLSSYVENQIEYRYQNIPDSIKWQKLLQLRFEVIKTDLSGEPRDAALFGLTSEFSHALRQDDFFDLLQTIDTYFQDNVTAEHFLRKFRRVAEDFVALKTGHPAPDIALPDINGDTIRLSDLKGKVLYVDFWGTWCYPCLQELPHSLTLQEKLKGENIEFVYIALEGGPDQVAEWKAFVSGKRAFDYAPFLAQQTYPGIHLLSEGQFNNPQIKPYKINAAPTYMLIDATGRIVTARAPRPSSPNIETLLKETISKQIE